ncbi:hypothetical protein L226DRAFT_456359 [Lentinus tigrinus ALCF2SS1-7]|uniref:Uncharacterized protein n=1 Tax=Lentinus tigrinus ALCF2SS1-6 TaxID=1328759 RepID=A0A5C2RPZ1_9APHY|nr:hypothetical protein L227DRAFT_512802 [Lentinus tigrinus ALCF2SS1-6]RPD79648.1 hypothetical protein L226DRAFT_456359 [Lentinus tigrinus ALCF2SS1-7]
MTTAIDAVQTQILPRVCGIPLVPSAICGVVQPQLAVQTTPLQRADFPGLARIQDVALDTLLEKSSGGSALAVNVKHAELAVKDLVAAVRASNLSIKSVLADALSNFAADAHSAGHGLQRLTARMHVAVDSIASLNTYALRTIEAATERTSAEIERTVRRAFEASIDGLSSQLTRVIVEATTTMVALDRLEDRLFEIRSLCVPEALLTEVELHDLLWTIWSILGSNKEKIRDLRHREAVLREVAQYRAVALAYVSAAAQTLQGLEAELSELRDRLTGVAAGPHDMPVEVHLASIERSIRRFDAGAQGRGHVIDA